ncbi:MAG: hypothetical protein AB7U98_12230 [Candidatus Nitrosocosmicus sp.]
MYKNNKIHQKITKSNGNDKLTLPVVTFVTFMLIASVFSVSTGMNNSFATTTDSQQVLVSPAQNESVPITSSDDMARDQPVLHKADPEAYSHEVDYESSLSLDDTSEQRIDVRVANNFDEGMKGIQIDLQVEYPNGDAFIGSGTTNSIGRSTFIVPLDGEGLYKANIIVSTPEANGGTFEEDISWEVTGSPSGPGGGSGTYEVDVSLASEEVDIENNPLQRIDTTVEDPNTGDPVQDIKLTVGVTNPSGAFKEYPRITDSDGEDHLTVPVDEVGEYTAEINVMDPNTNDIVFSDNLSWTAS